MAIEDWVLKNFWVFYLYQTQWGVTAGETTGIKGGESSDVIPTVERRFYDDGTSDCSLEAVPVWVYRTAYY